MRSQSSAGFLLASAVLAIRASAQFIPVPVPDALGLEKRQKSPTVLQTNTFAGITPSNEIEWAPCYQELPSSQFGELSCARLIAPLDYHNESAGEVQLAIVKLAAQGESSRTVFFNPGGPGGSPIDSIVSEGDSLRLVVGNDSDIIGIVPRGVGPTSPPMTCDPSDTVAAIRYYHLTYGFNRFTEDTLTNYYGMGESLSADCKTVVPDLYEHVGTASVARDMNLVMETLGIEKLSYYGVSYGTALGATFAMMFPEKVERMVLDAVVDTADMWYSVQKEAGVISGEADLALERMFEACFEAGPEKCPIYADSCEEIAAKYAAADLKLLKKAFPVPGVGFLEYGIWKTAVFSALYSPIPGFQAIANATAEIEAGEAGPGVQFLLSTELGKFSPQIEPPLIDEATGRQNTQTLFGLTVCADSGIEEGDPTEEELQAIYDRAKEASQWFPSVAGANEIFCRAMKIAAKERPGPEVLTQGPDLENKILFVTSTADPITPSRNAQRMAEFFPGSGLLTLEGTGHGIKSANPAFDCAAQYVVPYFQDGTLPEEGATCEGGQVYFP